MNRIFLLFPLIIICFRFISGFKTVRCPALVLKTRFGRLNSIDANGAAKDEILGKTENDFIVNIESDVTEEEISNLNLIKIVNLEATDLQCNQLCWKCLGYLYDPSTGDYDNSNVFPKWREKYPNPPDVIGMKRIYSPDVDKPVRDASIALMRSIPRDFKGGVRSLEKDGFRGFKLKELTPNKTRRAQLVNWLLFYREKLFKRTLDELLAEKQSEQPKSDEEAALPSEKIYQKSRID